MLGARQTVTGSEVIARLGRPSEHPYVAIPEELPVAAARLCLGDQRRVDLANDEQRDVGGVEHLLGRQALRLAQEQVGPGRRVALVQSEDARRIEGHQRIELVQLEVDVIFAGGDAAVRAAKQATRTIPIVMLISGDPVSSGLVASLNQPGGNVTGVTGLSPRLTARRVEILKQAVPTLSHVAVLFNPDDETKTVDRQQLQVTTRALGVRLHSVAIRSPDQFERGFRTMVQERVDGLIVLSTAFTSFHRTQIIKLAAEHRLPAIYERKEFVEAGGLIAYGPSLPDMLRQAAIYIDNILQGAKPSTLPVEQAKKFELAVNLETANALGLTLPPSILSWADVVMR